MSLQTIKVWASRVKRGWCILCRFCWPSVVPPGCPHSAHDLGENQKWRAWSPRVFPCHGCPPPPFLPPQSGSGTSWYLHGGRPGRVSPTVVESFQFLRESEVQGSACGKHPTCVCMWPPLGKGEGATSEVPSSGSHLTEP